MDVKTKTDDLELSPEEHKVEQEALKEVAEADLREKLAEEFGIDPDVETELLDKLVAREKDNREKLSGAIRQKIKYRDRMVNQTPQKPEDGKDNPTKPGDVDVSQIVSNQVNEILEKERLDALNLPEEIAEEVKTLAKLKNISIREAAEMPYIKSLIGNYDAEKRVNEGTPARTRNTSAGKRIDLSKPLNPDNYNFDTEEGRAAWARDKAEREKLKRQQG